MSHNMTKPTNWLCAQWRLRSAWAHTQSDQSLHCCTQWVVKDPSFLHAVSKDWSDWADARVDLSLRWPLMPFCWFCHEVAQIAYLHVHYKFSSFNDANNDAIISPVKHEQSLFLRVPRSGQKEVVIIERWNYIEIWNLGETKSGLCSQVVFIHRWSLKPWSRFLRNFTYSIYRQAEQIMAFFSFSRTKCLVAMATYSCHWLIMGKMKIGIHCYVTVDIPWVVLYQT